MVVGTGGHLGSQRALVEVVKLALACKDPLACELIHAENPAAKLDISFSLLSIGSIEIRFTQSSTPFSPTLVAFICPTFFAFFLFIDWGQAVSLVPLKATYWAGRS